MLPGVNEEMIRLVEIHSEIMETFIDLTDYSKSICHVGIEKQTLRLAHVDHLRY